MRRMKRKLAASFVVTIAVMPACKKTTITDPEPPEGTQSVSINDFNGKCTLYVPMSCPKGASCNPPPPEEVDCPPGKGDASAPPGVARRPLGKEDWIRVKPRANAWSGRCSWSGERFVAPPGKPMASTAWPTSVEVKCTAKSDAGTEPHAFETFVWKDILGQCHEVKGLECVGQCDLPEGKIVPCT
jgi:hypothetical protein